MALTLTTHIIEDPDGHDPALLLQGDWLLIAVSDGVHTGVGEASHSGDDQACAAIVEQLFAGLVADRPLTPEGIRLLEQDGARCVDSFVAATALSGLNQALYDLLARRQEVPVWRLFVDRPIRTRVPVYVTINRALRGRMADDFCAAVRVALGWGVKAVKCAPFHNVRGPETQLHRAEDGLAILRLMRHTFPDLSLRVDCHQRFTADSFLALLPVLDALGLTWIEEPTAPGPVLRDYRAAMGTPLAAGELHFGAAPFLALAERGWADVVMPDVKHVGGFGPLLDVCRALAAVDVQVSPHNPSGPVATLASAHAVAISAQVTSLELALRSDGSTAARPDWIVDGELVLPAGPGWGVDAADLIAG